MKHKLPKIAGLFRQSLLRAEVSESWRCDWSVTCLHLKGEHCGVNWNTVNAATDSLQSHAHGHTNMAKPLTAHAHTKTNSQQQNWDWFSLCGLRWLSLFAVESLSLSVKKKKRRIANTHTHTPSWLWPAGFLSWLITGSVNYCGCFRKHLTSCQTPPLSRRPAPPPLA